MIKHYTRFVNIPVLTVTRNDTAASLIQAYDVTPTQAGVLLHLQSGSDEPVTIATEKLFDLEDDFEEFFLQEPACEECAAEEVAQEVSEKFIAAIGENGARV